MDVLAAGQERVRAAVRGGGDGGRGDSGVLLAGGAELDVLGKREGISGRVQAEGGDAEGDGAAAVAWGGSDGWTL